MKMGTEFYAYSYVGPREILAAAASQPVGATIDSSTDLASWLAGNPDARREGATYVVDTAGLLRLAPRRSEHVACAGREDVLAAGEVRFVDGSAGPSVAMVSNQSTGYCPDITSWEAVARALRHAGIASPGRFTHELIFRRCSSCSELNIVKESWFVCVFCNKALPNDWNAGKRRVVRLD